MKKRFLLTADWELTDERLKAAVNPLLSLQKHMRVHMEDPGEPRGVPFERVIFLGDLLRTFTTNTATVARRALEKYEPWLLCGNHDYATGIDRLTAIFEGVPGAEIIKEPMVKVIDNVALAFLPSPDRQAFGAARKAEGKRARDLALSEALEAALIALETMVEANGIDLANACLLFHGTLEGTTFGSQVATGLTWTIPEARLANWGAYWGGHIHKPAPHYVGTIAPFTFGEVVPTYRAVELVVDTEKGDFEALEYPLAQAVNMLELTFESFEPGQFVNELLARIDEAWFAKPSPGMLNLKVRAKMPTATFAAVPSAGELRTILEAKYPSKIYDLLLVHEPTETRVTRLSDEAKKLPLSELFLEFLAVNNIEADPETVDLALAKLPLITQAIGFNEDPESLFAFEPLRIKLENFRQWEDAELDFTTLEGTVSITGPNYSGKSNLLEAVLFALFKRSPASEQGIEHELRTGATSGLVELEFTACGARYIVRRALEAGKSSVTCKTELLTLVPCLSDEAITTESNIPHKWGAVGELTSAEMQKEIERLVGSYDFVTSTFISTQKDADKLLKATPTEWGRLLIEALALGRYKAFHEYAKEQEGELRKDNEKNAAVLENIEERLVIERETLEAFTTPEALERKGALESKKAGAEASIEHLTAEVSALEAKKDEANKDLGELREKVGAISGLTDRVDGIRRELSEIEKTLSAGLGAAPPPPVLTSEHYKGLVEAAELKLKAQKDELDESYKVLHEAEREDEDAKDELKKATTAFDEANKVIVERDTTTRPDVPCWFDPTPETPEPETLWRECPAFAELTGKERYERAAAECKKQLEAQETARGKIRVAEGKVAQASGAVELNIKAHDGTKDALEKLNADLKEVQDAEAAVAGYNAKVEGFNSSMERKRVLEKELPEVEAKLKALLPLKDKVNALKDEVAGRGQDIIDRKDELETSRKALKSAEHELAEHEKERVATERALEKLQENKAEVEAGRGDNERELLAFELIARAFHNTGIPFLLMEQAAGLFEAQVNKFLEPTDFTIEVLTQKPTKAGVVRDKVNIYFYDFRGRHPLSFASGMQASCFKFTLAAGLACMGSLFMGTPPRMFTQDEGWDVFEVEKRPVALELIRLMAEAFKTFFFIAHLAIFYEAADTQLRVKVDNGRSSLVRL